MHHVDAPENVTRSIGVYEWTGDLAKPVAARLIPVSLFIDGDFKDGRGGFAVAGIVAGCNDIEKADQIHSRAALGDLQFLLIARGGQCEF